MATKMMVGGLLVAVAMTVAAGCSSSSGASGTCASLSTCCPQLTASDQATTCKEIVAQADDSACAAAQTNLEGDLLCQVVDTTSGGGTGCSGLSSCCASLSSEEQIGCNAIVQENNDGSCSSALTEYETSGLCSSHTIVITPGSGTGTGGGTGCSGLSSCCASVPSAYTTSCNTVVSEGDDAACTEELTAYHTDGYCGGSSSTGTGTGTGSGGSGCSGLSSCCASVPSEYTTSCNTVVSEGSDAACSEELSAYQTDGYCGGSSTGTGTGTGSGGSGCSGLSSSCIRSAPMRSTSCNTVVSEGSDAACSEELSAYQTDGYCAG
jgi:hypothetical protein